MAKQPKGETRDISKKEKFRRNATNAKADEIFQTYIKPAIIAAAGSALVMFFLFFYKASA